MSYLRIHDARRAKPNPVHGVPREEAPREAESEVESKPHIATVAVRAKRSPADPESTDAPGHSEPTHGGTLHRPVNKK